MTSVNRVRLGNRGSPSASGHPGAAGMGSFSQFWRIALGRVCKVCLGEIAWLMGMFRVSVFGGGGDGVGMGCWGVGSGQEGGFVFRVIFAPGVSLFFGVLVGYLNLGWLMLSFFVFFFFSCVGAEPPPGGDNAVGGVLAGVFAKSGKVCFFFSCEHLGPASGENAVGLSFKKRKVHFN